MRTEDEGACGSDEICSSQLAFLDARGLESDVYVNPSSLTNEYARQLGDCIVAILDDIAPSKMITKRRGCLLYTSDAADE